MATVLVTGAAGFIGSALVDCLLAQGHAVRALARNAQAPRAGVEQVVVDLVESQALLAACQGVDAVVHLAGRAHVLQETAGSPLEAFRRVNVEATLRLAEAAAQAGVARFVFVSSIGVNGDATFGAAFDEQSPAQPHADYALSKLEAEQALIDLGQRVAMQWVIVRPPMVIDSQAPGNFARLLKLVDRALPLPFGLARNRRSLVSRRNLADLLARCIEHPAAAGQVFLAADGDDVSTADMVRALAKGMQRPARLLPVPVSPVRLACSVLGRRRLYNQLFGSLQVDAGKARRLLGWEPLESTNEALTRIGAQYRQQR
ncbi:NAD-dependent epimerase/dehydratase family protein [Pseudomonas xanthosomatis]|uniref:NAD-dependent epimerase/dehydratase family protein n=1 Tax=Pseudomonas xanthosomatis TaxID=2842356 RepID=UPI003515AA66